MIQVQEWGEISHLNFSICVVCLAPDGEQREAGGASEQSPAGERRLQGPHGQTHRTLQVRTAERSDSSLSRILIFTICPSSRVSSMQNVCVPMCPFLCVAVTEAVQ